MAVTAMKEKKPQSGASERGSFAERFPRPAAAVPLRSGLGEPERDPPVTAVTSDDIPYRKQGGTVEFFMRFPMR